MAKGRTAKAKYAPSGVAANGMQKFDAVVKIGKMEYASAFEAPATLADAAKHAQADAWYAALLRGVYAGVVKRTRQSNDTFILWKGKRQDALALKPGILARYLTLSFQSIADKMKPGETPDVPAKLALIEKLAIERKLVTRKDDVVDGDAVVTFNVVK